MHLYSEDILLKKTSFLPDNTLSENTINQRVLIIHNEKLDEKIIIMIHNMMKACGLLEKDYHLISLLEHPISWKKLCGWIDHTQEIIIFDEIETILSLNITFKHNLPTRFDDKVWIKTHSLKEINEQQEQKANFWNHALKPYFIS